MPKQMMTEREYEVYKKIHRYPDPVDVDVEEGKVEQEKSDYVKYRRKSDAKIKEILREMIKSGSLEMGDEWDVVAYEVKGTREIRNAQKHKRRLQDLKRYET
jgi:hypothetical protein